MVRYFRGDKMKRNPSISSSTIVCPFCDTIFEKNCEYVDIGVGFQQCTPNYCEECGASEQGMYPDRENMERKSGWWRINEKEIT